MLNSGPSEVKVQGLVKLNSGLGEVKFGVGKLVSQKFSLAVQIFLQE